MLMLEMKCHKTSHFSKSTLEIWWSLHCSCQEIPVMCSRDLLRWSIDITSHHNIDMVCSSQKKTWVKGLKRYILWNTWYVLAAFTSGEAWIWPGTLGEMGTGAIHQHPVPISRGKRTNQSYHALPMVLHVNCQYDIFETHDFKDATWTMLSPYFCSQFLPKIPFFKRSKLI